MHPCPPQKLLLKIPERIVFTAVQPQWFAAPPVVVSYVPAHSQNGPDKSRQAQNEDDNQNTHGNLLKDNKRECGPLRSARSWANTHDSRRGSSTGHNSAMHPNRRFVR
jgi:hypothetical protein